MRLSSYIHLSPHVLEHKLQPLDQRDTAQLLWNYRRNDYTSKHTPADAFQLLSHHHLQAQEVVGYRVCTTNKRKPGDSDACGQEQYLTQYEPLIMEKWALPLLRHIPDIKKTTETSIARKDFLDASCEICCDPGTFEDPHDHEPATDLYQCDVCNRTYHWRCLKELQCYTE